MSLFFILNKNLFTGTKSEGESGELVCTKPFPSMPVHFWNDPNNEKYTQAYFDKFPGFLFATEILFQMNNFSFLYVGIWNHSDFCFINPVTRGIVMLGRRSFIETFVVF
jgi:acetoacetyl-CoA synthetase